MKVIKGYSNYKITEDAKIFNQYGKEMKQHGNGKGRLTLMLVGDNGIQKRLQVHRLVAENYITNPNQYPIVMHKDDNSWNNHIDNLMWGTQQMNMDDMISKDRSKRTMSDSIIKQIKKLHPSLSYQQLADKFDYSKSAIAFVIQERRYKNII